MRLFEISRCLLPPGETPNDTKIRKVVSCQAVSPAGRYDNSPTFQRWGKKPINCIVPKGRLTNAKWFSHPFGTSGFFPCDYPTLERLGYSQSSLRDDKEILVALSQTPRLQGRRDAHRYNVNTRFLEFTSSMNTILS